MTFGPKRKLFDTGNQILVLTILFGARSPSVDMQKERKKEKKEEKRKRQGGQKAGYSRTSSMFFKLIGKPGPSEQLWWRLSRVTKKVSKFVWNKHVARDN